MTLQDLFTTLKGNTHSGNYGHAGRPGHEGGSVPKGRVSPKAKLIDKLKKPLERKLEPKKEESKGDTDPNTWKDRLSSQELSAVKTYAGSRYQEINSGLRSGKLSKEDEKTVALLDSALSKSRLTEQTTLYENQKLYRAASIPEVNQALKSGKIEGLEFSDKGFVSTTASLKTAQNFQRGEGSRLFIINAPKGTKAGNVGSLSHGLKEEKEFLLPRGSKFKVSKVEKVKEKVEYRDFKGKIKTRTQMIEYVHMDIVS